jgi:hypothetical protein
MTQPYSEKRRAPRKRTLKGASIAFIEAAVFYKSRLEKLSQAIRGSIVKALKNVPPDDFFQIISDLPKTRFFHPPGFVGHTYTKGRMIS